MALYIFQKYLVIYDKTKNNHGILTYFKFYFNKPFKVTNKPMLNFVRLAFICIPRVV